MKNSKEIAAYVFKARDEMLEKKAENRKHILRFAPAAAICLSLVILFVPEIYLKNTVPGTSHSYDYSAELITESVTDTTEDVAESAVTKPELSSETDSVFNVTENKPLISESSAFPVSSDYEPEHSENEKPSKQEPDLSVTDRVLPMETTPAPQDTQSPESPTPQITPPPSPADTAGNASVTTTVESLVIPAWNEKEIYEKFSEIKYNNHTYVIKHRTLGQDRISEKLTEISVSATDILTDNKYSSEASVYRINSISEKFAIALQFRDSSRYCIYTVTDYFPATLGEFYEEIQGDKNLEFGKMTIHEGVPVAGMYSADTLRDVITENMDTPCIVDETSHPEIYLISTNLNILGINDRYTVITSDGWIMTNIMEWRYSFFIGSDAVRKISETVISDMQ